MGPNDINIGGVLSDAFLQAPETLVHEGIEAASDDLLGRDVSFWPTVLEGYGRVTVNKQRLGVQEVREGLHVLTRVQRGFDSVEETRSTTDEIIHEYSIGPRNKSIGTR